MTWFKVDDSLDFHPKVEAAGNQAMGLWVRAGSYCSRMLTEGFVAAKMVTKLGGRPKDSSALVAAGLWEAVEGGFQFHDWNQANPTKEKVQADKAAAAERQRRAREKAAVARAEQSRRDSQRDSRVTNGVSHGPPDPTRPDPLSTYSPRSVSESSGTRGPTTPAGQVVAAWTAACKAAGISPISDQSTTVGNQALQLLDQGNDLELILIAAELGGTMGKQYIADFIGRAVAKQRERDASVVSPNDPVWGATLGSTA